METESYDLFLSPEEKEILANLSKVNNKEKINELFRERLEQYEQYVNNKLMSSETEDKAKQK